MEGNLGYSERKDPKNIILPEKPKEMLVQQNLELRENILFYREQTISLREEICELKEKIIILEEEKEAILNSISK